MKAYVPDKVFPEYQSVFSYVFSEASKEILLQFPHPIDFESVSSEILAKLVTLLSTQKVGTINPKLLKNVASHSFGITFAKSSFPFQLEALIEISFIKIY